MSRRPDAAPGFTMLEGMLVTAIIGVVVMVGPRLMIQLQNFYLLTTARQEIQRDARASISVINRFLRQAKHQSITIDSDTGQGPYSRIRFTHVDGRGFTFAQNGAQLLQTVNGNVTILSRNLVYVAFTFPRSDDPTLVSVSMTMGKNIQLGQRKALELTIQKIRVMN